MKKLDDENLKEKKEEKKKKEVEVKEKEAKEKKEIKSEKSASVGVAVKKEKVSAKEVDFGINIEEMEKAGVNFGHWTTRLHPKMEPYLAGIRNTVHIIDLEKTAEKLQEALKFIREFISQDKTLILVGTKIQVKELVKDIAEDCGLSYVRERWLGGTLTNFGVISKRIEYFKDMEKKKEEGGLEKYTKKERVKINKEFGKLKIKFEGLKDLKRLPDALFVLDIRKDDLAVKEARMKGIKIIAICDTNVDPTLVDYPIPANDDAISSVKYILEKVKEVILGTRSKTK